MENFMADASDRTRTADAAHAFPLPLSKHHYGGEVLLGAFEPVPGDYNRRTVDNYGLPQAVSATYAWVRGESGRLYNATRQFHHVMSPRLRVTSAMPGDSGADAAETRD